MATKLDKNFYLFGNKGDSIWNKNTHIAEIGFGGTTLCGKPMLSTNWARIEKVAEPGCPDCIKLYEEALTEKAVNND